MFLLFQEQIAVCNALQIEFNSNFYTYAYIHFQNISLTFELEIKKKVCLYVYINMRTEHMYVQAGGTTYGWRSEGDF